MKIDQITNAFECEGIRLLFKTGRLITNIANWLIDRKIDNFVGELERSHEYTASLYCQADQIGK